MAIHPIQYRLTFDDGKEEVFSVKLDSETMAYQPDEALPPPEWARLENRQCGNCPLRPETSPYCPVARNLAPVIERFVNRISFEEVNMSVTVPAREYRGRVALQKAIGAIFGLVMATSGCPVLDKMRPMASTHLPMAELGETRYRAVSMYLMAQFLRARRGLSAEWDLKGLEKIYDDIGEVNRDFIARLRGLKMEDANFNAIVGLDCFRMSSDVIIARSLDKLESVFRPYL